MSRALAAVLFVAGLSVSGAQARLLVERGDFAMEISGSLRQRTVFTRATGRTAFNRAITASLPEPTCVSARTFADCSAFALAGEQDVWQSLTRLRTRIDVQLAPGLTGAVAYDHELLLGTLDTVEQRAAEGAALPPLLPLQQKIKELDFGSAADGGQWRHLVYRAYIAYDRKPIELIAGRQRIPWGVGRLWSPLDRFNFIQPLAVEPDQTPGVDAIDVKWRFSGFSYLEGVYAPLGSADDAAYAVRAHGVLRDSDYSVVAGIFQEARMAGVDFARNVGDAAVRAEAVYTDPERSAWPLGEPRPGELRGFWQIVVSADRNFNVGSGLYVLLEHLYNGNALGFGGGRAGPLLSFFEASEMPPAGLSPENAQEVGPPFVTTSSANRFGSSQVISLGRQQTGFQLGYDIFPSLRAGLIGLCDWEGPSVAMAPVLRYEQFGFIELTFGAQFFAGPRRSEYGSTENTAFLIAEAFY